MNSNDSNNMHSKKLNKRMKWPLVGLMVLGLGMPALDILQNYLPGVGQSVGGSAGRFMNDRVMAERVTTDAARPQWTDAQIVNADLIRVGISDSSMVDYEYGMTQITSAGKFKLTDKSNGLLLLEGTPGQIVSVTRSKDGFAFQCSTASKSLVKGPLIFEPAKADGTMKIVNITRKSGTPSYRGTLEILPGYSSPAKFSVVNVLPLQDYLKAVVPNELPARYGYEAVKAQAVAARNYAIRPREKPWPQFDICDSQYCQAYYGAQTETPSTTAALKETEGLLALYDGEPILALYSSSHGGAGESYSFAFSDPKTNKFPATPLPYLQGGPDIPDEMKGFGSLRSEKGAKSFWTSASAKSYDVLSPNYRWSKSWSRPELEAQLNRTLYEVSKDSSTAPFVTPLFKVSDSIGQLKHINVVERGVSGKAMVIDIVGSKGTWTVKKEFLIRKVFKHQGKMLPSANVVFTHLVMGKDRVARIKADGGGFGHGVGMSQLGASYMDKSGYRFPEILQHYYKGISLGTLPLQVGTGAYLKPVKTTFFTKKANATLWVETQTPRRPILVMLNDRTQKVYPESFNGKRAKIQVTLNANAENSFTLYPDAQTPAQPIKAWIEVVPPAS